MKLGLLFWVGGVLFVFLAFNASVTEARTTSTPPRPSLAHLLRRCENNYDDDEIAAIIANGDDGYEPDDCPLLAHTLTGPMGLNFCQPGDEDWVLFHARANVVYQIRAATNSNYPTEPHLDLLERDGGSLLAANDHSFGNNAEIWWWNGGGDRIVYIRATEVAGRHDCGNSAYTLTLHAYPD
jgi:hypothetical protein